MKIELLETAGVTSVYRALHLPFGWLNQEMLESLFEVLVISHVSQKRCDHTGATPGLLLISEY